MNCLNPSPMVRFRSSTVLRRDLDLSYDQKMRLLFALMDELHAGEALSFSDLQDEIVPGVLDRTDPVPGTVRPLLQVVKHLVLAGGRHGIDLDQRMVVFDSLCGLFNELLGPGCVIDAA